MQNIASYIDHTVLKPTTTEADIVRLCNEAIHYHFIAVCVPPCYVALAKEHLKDTKVKIATVVGFPLGYNTVVSKLKEIEEACSLGADEIDTVHNIAKLKSADWIYLEEEIRLCTEAIHQKDKIIKVIIESGVLTQEELIKCCQIYAPLGIDFMKTSTGFAETGATIEAVRIMRANLPSHIQIKASGGIRDYASAKQYIDAGATRIGTSSGIQIVKESNVF
ncbi:MAG: deoxyribose-phosphate aldolase [Bacteroidetes bacterium]|nr:deoxyribose-phosphate aldolase [Bacteroidota bacterium]